MKIKVVIEITKVVPVAIEKEINKINIVDMIEKDTKKFISSHFDIKEYDELKINVTKESDENDII